MSTNIGNLPRILRNIQRSDSDPQVYMRKKEINKQDSKKKPKQSSIKTFTIHKDPESEKVRITI